jgi:simple sugar transport system permease protein/D-ribose pyranase
MKAGGIINRDLSLAIAAMGHGDLMIVTDAGFPIPSDVWTVDLSLIQDVPDLETVLTALKQEFLVEKYAYATELVENKSPFLKTLEGLYPDVESEVIPHAEIKSDYAPNAKVIVRTGAYQPYGNTLLFSGVDLPVWMAKWGQ